MECGFDVGNSQIAKMSIRSNALTMPILKTKKRYSYDQWSGAIQTPSLNLIDVNSQNELHNADTPRIGCGEFNAYECNNESFILDFYIIIFLGSMENKI